mmetsp:Transcript_23267/g.62095  ORF Transcript_23267/g.62095 Transcript_23267/m.62095 type:complete len:352 (+) Transcript_23267:194-1249(+)
MEVRELASYRTAAGAWRSPRFWLSWFGAASDRGLPPTPGGRGGHRRGRQRRLSKEGETGGRSARCGTGGTGPRRAARGGRSPQEPSSGRLFQVYQHDRDVVDHRAALLPDPAVPRLLCKLLRRLHGLLGLELSHNVVGLGWLDELPYAVAADKQRRVVLGEVVLLDLWLAADAAVLVSHQVAQAPGHVQARIARALRVDAVVRVAIEDDAASVLLDASSLVRQLRLVVARERLAVPLAPRRRPYRGGAVGHVGNRDLVVGVIVDGNGARGAGELGAELLHAVGARDERLHLLESIYEHRRHLVRHEAAILYYELRQVLLDEIRDIVALLAVPVEDGVDRAVLLALDAEHEP